MDALLAAATPLSEFLIERSVERPAARAAARPSLEAKLAAVRDLAPFVKLLPEGLSRTTFEDAIARRLDLDADGAPRRDLRGASARGATPSP